MHTDFKDVVRERLNEMKMQPNDLAKGIGMSVQHTYNLLNGKRRWNESLMDTACKTLGLEIHYKKMKG